MTIFAFLEQLQKSTAHRLSRELIKSVVLDNNQLLKVLFNYGCQLNQKDYHKAWWVMELVFEEKLELLNPFINDFCNISTQIKSDSALRSLTKICLFISKSKIILEEPQKESIYQCLFDCLIQTNKAANAAYCMYALFEFGKKDRWIHEELKLILSKGFENQTPAYRAATKITLGKLQKLLFTTK